MERYAPERSGISASVRPETPDTVMLEREVPDRCSILFESAMAFHTPSFEYEIVGAGYVIPFITLPKSFVTLSIRAVSSSRVTYPASDANSDCSVRSMLGCVTGPLTIVLVASASGELCVLAWTLVVAFSFEYAATTAAAGWLGTVGTKLAGWPPKMLARTIPIPAKNDSNIYKKLYHPSDFWHGLQVDSGGEKKRAYGRERSGDHSPAPRPVKRAAAGASA